jgi:hypothetical protein
MLGAWPMAVLLGAYYAADMGSPTEALSLWNNLLFFSSAAADADDAPTFVGRDREPTLVVHPNVGTSSFPLLELEIEPAPLWLMAAFALGICTPWDASPTYCTAISISSSEGISFNSFDLGAWSKKIGMQAGGRLMKSAEFG